MPGFAVALVVGLLPVGAGRAQQSPSYRAQVRGRSAHEPALPGRATSRVSRRDLEERLPRSAPDALRYEPGVFVQQTAHAQGSAFIRGLTGQQTILLYDGVRLNNSLYRQGPNQYFFTIDSQTVAELVVTRGAASVRYGSDALGGTIEARPIGPGPPPPPEVQAPALDLHPLARFRATTADRELGGRFQVAGWIGRRLGVLAGGGYRDVGLLRGPPVSSLDPSVRPFPWTPTYLPDGVTQRGTGFREGTADLRLVLPVGPGRELVAAAYQYLQFDAPRTDQCPPFLAPLTECLRYEEQFRTLAYLSFRGGTRWRGLEQLEVTASYQQQHERRRADRPLERAISRGLDVVNTLGLMARGQSRPWERGPLRLQGRYGLDLYHDSVSSQASLELSDFGRTLVLSRGQYVAGSRYLTSGIWAEAEGTLWQWLVLRAGGRLGLVSAQVPADPDSGTRPVDRVWLPYAFDAGVELRPRPELALVGNLNQGFRAPNLDDLSSRQTTGPGFQFENPALEPERALTVEAGLRLELPWLELAAYAFNTSLLDAIARQPRRADECPSGGPLTAGGCATAWSRFQLINLPGRAVLWGAEAHALLRLPLGVSLRTTVAYAFGEGPNPVPPAPAQRDYQPVVPLSRVPPLNGTCELRWRWPAGIFFGAGLRWALAQNRLAPGDFNDVRIPPGGTPGFVVLDLRAGLRLHELLRLRPSRRLLVQLVAENLLDAAHRYHGSSVNGPGRGLILQAEAGL
ncbi:MAG: TonB-dependent receptor [Myxococcales bacterium]|nr:TonB-dependent receptor [Myxococcales bacterium]